MSALLAALGAVLAHFEADTQPGASVLVHIANDAWSQLKDAAAADATLVGTQLLTIIGSVAQEVASDVNPTTHTKVQFAAGDWTALRDLHAAATAAPVSHEGEPPSM